MAYILLNIESIIQEIKNTCPESVVNSSIEYVEKNYPQTSYGKKLQMLDVRINQLFDESINVNKSQRDDAIHSIEKQCDEHIQPLKERLDMVIKELYEKYNAAVQPTIEASNIEKDSINKEYNYFLEQINLKKCECLDYRKKMYRHAIKEVKLERKKEVR